MTAPFDHERWEELAVAHALDALEPSEEASFVDHLGQCAHCRTVVDDVSATAADLALTADQVEPSPDLRASLLDVVSRTPQDPRPVRAPLAVPHPSSDPVSLSGPGAPVDLQRAAARRRRNREHVGRWLVGAAAGLALVGGLVFVGTYDGDKPGNSRVAAAFSRCLDDSGCKPIRLVGDDGTVLAAVLVRGEHTEVVSERLAPNPASSTSYVLWAQHTAGPVKAVGVFDVTSEDASVHDLADLPWKLTDISAFMVSREAGNVAPATGSAPVATGTVKA